MLWEDNEDNYSSYWYCVCLVLVYFLKLVILGFISGRIAGRISEICGKKWTKSLCALYVY